jgi:hypothetical protein
MPGVPGRGGPVPKRAEDRRRRNKVNIDTVEMVGEVEIPPADDNWHDLAIEWYESLAKSGQSRYYEPSDWTTARYIAEAMSRNLLNPRGFSDKLFAAVLSGMGNLLTTEGERRRVRMEIERAKNAPAPKLASVTPIDRFGNL